eukprot:6709195-Prymnesium_polylepis.2
MHMNMSMNVGRKRPLAFFRSSSKRRSKWRTSTWTCCAPRLLAPPAGPACWPRLLAPFGGGAGSTRSRLLDGVMAWWLIGGLADWRIG